MQTYVHTYIHIYLVFQTIIQARLILQTLTLLQVTIADPGHVVRDALAYMEGVEYALLSPASRLAILDALCELV